MKEYQEKINYKNFSIAWGYDDNPDNPFECDGTIKLASSFGSEESINDLISIADANEQTIDEYLKANKVNYRYIGWRYGGNVQGDREFYLCGKKLQYHDGLSVLYSDNDKCGYKNDEEFERMCHNLLSEYQAYYNHDFVLLDIDDNLGNEVEHNIAGFTNSEDAIQYAKDYIDKYMSSTENKCLLAVNGSINEVRVELEKIIAEKPQEMLSTLSEKTLRKLLYELYDTKQEVQI